jgi:MYXO-CTERM domain-containing protein
MKTAAAIAIVGTASLVASADAGFLGFVASVRTVGANTVIDIFAGVENASDKFLNVYNANISTTLAGGFVQKAGLATKTWKPDTAGFTSTRNTSDDSFFTAGTFSGGAYGGEFYASSNTNGDPNFTGTSWNATPASPAATTVPANAGWYTGDPTSVDNRAESLAGMIGRVNSGSTAASGNTAGSVGSANANFGIWCGHIVVAGNGTMGTNLLWSASISIKDGVTGATDQRISSFVPAPGALALVGLAGFASRRRRA